METKYFVCECYRSASETHGWEYKMTGMYSDLKTAKQSFHARLGAIIKPANDFASVILYDSYGNKIMSDFDNSYVEPEPEPNEGE